MMIAICGSGIASTNLSKHTFFQDTGQIAGQDYLNSLKSRQTLTSKKQVDTAISGAYGASDSPVIRLVSQYASTHKGDSQCSREITFARVRMLLLTSLILLSVFIQPGFERKAYCATCQCDFMCPGGEQYLCEPADPYLPSPCICYAPRGTYRCLAP